MASQEILEQICENCNTNYCTIREFLRLIKRKATTECRHYADGHEYCENILYLVGSNSDDRLLFQFKCIEEYKWIKSEELKRALSWDEAAMGWCDEGYASKFGEVWASGERDLYFFFREGTVPQRKERAHLTRTFEVVRVSTTNSMMACV